MTHCELLAKIDRTVSIPCMSLIIERWSTLANTPKSLHGVRPSFHFQHSNDMAAAERPLFPPLTGNSNAWRRTFARRTGVGTTLEQICAPQFRDDKYSPFRISAAQYWKKKGFLPSLLSDTDGSVFCPIFYCPILAGQ